LQFILKLVGKRGYPVKTLNWINPIFFKNILPVWYRLPHLRVCPSGQRWQKIREHVMHRKIGTALVALVLFAGPSTMSFAQNSTSGGVNPKGEGIGSTSSTHNPRPSSPGPTGMEKGKATGSEMGTDTSTHNPSAKPE
jgi:hypothetical protein